MCSVSVVTVVFIHTMEDYQRLNTLVHEGDTLHCSLVLVLQVHYYLHSDETKRSYLFTLLRLYLKNQDIDSLSQSLNILLETYIERRLLGDIRYRDLLSFYNN